jgi:hypothetical protein
MAKNNRISKFFYSIAACLIALAFIFSSTNSKSVQGVFRSETPGPHTALAPAAPYRGWLALDVNGIANAKTTYQSELYLPGSMTIEGWIQTPFIEIDSYYYNGVISNGNSFLLHFHRVVSPTYPWPTKYCIYFFVYQQFGTSVDEPNCRSSTDFLSGWHYFAYVFTDGTGSPNQTYWDGIRIGGANATTSPGAITTDYVLRYATGIDEIRISDAARYSGNFQVPLSPFSCDEHTRALWHFDEIEGSTTFHDACGVDNMLVGANGAHTIGFSGYKVNLPLIIR